MKKQFARWTGWRTKINHTHNCDRRRTRCVPQQLVDPFELCRFQHDADQASTWFQRSVVNLASSQECRGSSLLPELVAKLVLVFGGNGKILGGILYLRHHHDDGPDTDQPGKPEKISEWFFFFVAWVSQWIWCKITVINSVTANAVHCHRRVV